MDASPPLSESPPPKARGGRGFWFQVHFWLGWVAALPIALVCLTGAALVFQEPVQAWEHAVTAPAEGKAGRIAPGELVARLAGGEPARQVNHLQIPQKATQPYHAFVTEIRKGGPNRSYAVTVNPYTGTVTRVDAGFAPMEFLVALHRNLAAGPAGKMIVGVSSLVLLVTTLVGLVLWWPMRGRTLVRAWQRGTALDWHNAVGVVALAPLLVMAVTGVTFTWNRQIFPVLEKMQGAPLRQPRATFVPPEDGRKLPLATLLARVAEEHPGATLAAVQPSNLKAAPVQCFLQNGTSHFTIVLDPYTGREIGRDDGKGTGPFGWYQRNFGGLHTLQPYGLPVQVAWGALSAAGAFLAGSGLWVTLRRKRVM